MKKNIGLWGLAGAALLSAFILPDARKPETPQPIPLKNIVLSGELYQRSMQNFNRLEEEKYRPDKVFLTNKESNYWPGDTEGRTVLALVLDAQTTKREPKYLAEIIRLFPHKMNRKGYFGDVYSDSSLVSEQQLSSHGWVLRGLAEYYTWKKDPRVLAMIDTFIKNLVLPTKGYHKNYPIDPAERVHTGGHSGSQGQRHGNWLLSTDTSCDFIFLDGVVHAYQLRPSAELKSVVDEMVNRFLQIDQVKIKAQTHATLTALRALLRYYDITGNTNLLAAVEKRYQTYRTQGMTENYENYNWYGRPEWTEPCAVVDSYITAMGLWKNTGKKEYLEDAHHIYINGMAMEQRANGGFGLQNCAGAKNSPQVKVAVDEAHWCCTMRGGEGLSQAAAYTFFQDKNTVLLPFYQNAVATFNLNGKKLKLAEKTGYPFAGDVQLKVLENEVTAPVIKLFLPGWLQKPKITLNGKPVQFKQDNGFAEVKTLLKKGDVLQLESQLALRTLETLNKNSLPGYFTFRYGPHILSCQGTEEIKLAKNAVLEPKGKGVFGVKGQTVELKPLYHLMSPEVKEKPAFQRQILFKE